MPLTYTGRLVKPGNGAHPSLIDIAVGLSRQPRFAGQTRRWWSVLDHVLFGDDLIASGNHTLRLAWLLHDAHEAITADVPTDVKRETTLGAIQDGLDRWIFDAFYPGGHFNYRDVGWHREVKNLDKKCLVAEAHVVGPPGTPEAITELFGEPDPEALVYLRGKQYGSYLGVPPVLWSINPVTGHPAVREYLHRMNTLL